MAELDKVPGHNNATYGPVPKEDQIFVVEFLEIAPMPIIAYAHLRRQTNPYNIVLISSKRPSLLRLPPGLHAWPQCSGEEGGTVRR